MNLNAFFRARRELTQIITPLQAMAEDLATFISEAREANAKDRVLIDEAEARISARNEEIAKANTVRSNIATILNTGR